MPNVVLVGSVLVGAAASYARKGAMMNSTLCILPRLVLWVATAIYLLNAPPARAATVEYAFAYIGQPYGGPWQLYSGHTYNSTGGGVSFTRLGVGDYQFTIGTMSPYGNAQARAHASNNRCKVAWWAESGADTVIRVRCTTPAGAAADTYAIVIQYYHATGSDPLQTAYLRADEPSTPTYSPSGLSSYNSTGGINIISHGVELGEYLAFLPGLSTRGGDPHVTAYGTTTDYCKIASWYQMNLGTFVAVRCFNDSGNPIDTSWSLRYTHGHLADNGQFLGAYVLGNANWGSNISSSYTYTPNPLFQFHTSGITMVASNSNYSVVSVPTTSSGGTSVIVTGVGHDNTYCTTYGWSFFPETNDWKPTVACYTPAGTLVASGFTMTLLSLAPR